MYRFCCSRSTVSTSDSGTTIHPIRQPVIDQYFEKLLITTADGSWSSRRGAGPPSTMPW
jgi:hypothetical protein